MPKSIIVFQTSSSALLGAALGQKKASHRDVDVEISEVETSLLTTRLGAPGTESRRHSPKCDLRIPWRKPE